MNRTLFALICLLPLLAACSPTQIRLADIDNIHYAALPGSSEEGVVAIIDEQRGQLWYRLTSGHRLIGTINPPQTSLDELYEIAISADNHWLAVSSVGEGHPILDVFDLTAVLADNDDDIAHPVAPTASINPYPGGIWINSWDGDKLIIQSDVPLETINKKNRRVDDPGENAKVATYIWQIASNTITSKP